MDKTSIQAVYTEEELAKATPIRREIAKLTAQEWAKRWDEHTSIIREKKKELDIIKKHQEKKRRNR